MAQVDEMELLRHQAGPAVREHTSCRLAYAIGMPEPVAIRVDTFGMSEAAPQERSRVSSAGRLSSPHVRCASASGSRARSVRAPQADGGFSWERTDLARLLVA